MSVYQTMEDVTRPVPTLLGATSVVVGVAIHSTRMITAVMVSKQRTTVLRSCINEWCLPCLQILMSVKLELITVTHKMANVPTLSVALTAPVEVGSLVMESTAYVRTDYVLISWFACLCTAL